MMKRPKDVTEAYRKLVLMDAEIKSLTKRNEELKCIAEDCCDEEMLIELEDRMKNL